MPSRIIFIDSRIANYHTLITQLPVGSEVVLLDAERDGVMQIATALQGRTDIDAIDIISHGAPGSLKLGSGVLNSDNLADYATQLTKIEQHLADDGDILLYGCEVAQGEAGQSFIKQLARLTGANVAASTNLTGAADLGGDWVLEAQTGLIKSSTLQLSYNGILAIITGTIGDDVLTGTADDDTLTGDQGNDVLEGGAGKDQAFFFGNQADYVFSLDLNGQVTVRDTNTANGDEGTDTFSTIEIAHFTDGDITIPRTGGEFQVNTYTTESQDSPSITALSNGGFVVAWASDDQDGSREGIYAQRYDADGVVQGGEFRVNTYTTSDQSHPSITALSDGGFVAAWESFGQDGSNYGIYAQRYDADGVPQRGEFRVNTYTNSRQDVPSITALSNGGFVVAWASNDPDGIYAQRYDADGVVQGSEFKVNSHTSSPFQNYPSITALSNGGFVVTWMSSEQDASLGFVVSDIYAQRYDSNGVAQGGEFRVNTHTAPLFKFILRSLP